MTWQLEFDNRASKDLKRLDRQVQARVLDALTRMTRDPLRDAQAQRLVARDEYRIRVGDWRILVVPDRQRRVLTVRRILPRGRAYDR